MYMVSRAMHFNLYKFDYNPMIIVRLPMCAVSLHMAHSLALFHFTFFLVHCVFVFALFFMCNGRAEKCATSRVRFVWLLQSLFLALSIFTFDSLHLSNSLNRRVRFWTTTTTKWRWQQHNTFAPLPFDLILQIYDAFFLFIHTEKIIII